MGRIARSFETLANLAVVVACASIVWTAVVAQPPVAADGGSGVPATGSLPAEFLADRSGATGEASLVLIEFSDFHCPFCKRHSEGTRKDLVERHVDAGSLTYVFAHYPMDGLHPRARRAAEVAECAGRQGRFWAMHGKLFEAQAAQDDTDFAEHARGLGLDEGAFSECMKAGQSTRIDGDVRFARALGVQSTPTFFIGVKKDDGTVEIVRSVLGAVPAGVFDAALAEVGARKSWLEQLLRGIRDRI